jgi:hypothetical protein
MKRCHLSWLTIVFTVVRVVVVKLLQKNGIFSLDKLQTPFKLIAVIGHKVVGSKERFLVDVEVESF